MSGMLRSTASKVMWVGRAAVFAVGLAAILVLMFVAAGMVLGIGGKFYSGTYNQIESITRHAGSDAGTEQALAVESLATRRQIEFPRGYAQVKVTPTTVTLTGSKGINGVQRSTTDNSVYCFDLTFSPRTAVASAHLNNNATVGTALGSGVPAGCTAPFRDAAARTYAANTSAPLSDINFGIVFI
ncbi:MAG TPA: hypothetical protein VFI90_05885 [Rubrobacter sp.]|nr:hypothetical protein [Rubrobacter sp.]